MAVPGNQVRRGQCVLVDGVNFKILEYSLNTPGNKGGIVTLKLRNLENGANITIDSITLSQDPSAQILIDDGTLTLNNATIVNGGGGDGGSTQLIRVFAARLSGGFN